MNSTREGIEEVVRGREVVVGRVMVVVVREEGLIGINVNRAMDQIRVARSGVTVRIAVRTYHRFLS